MHITIDNKKPRHIFGIAAVSVIFLMFSILRSLRNLDPVPKNKQVASPFQGRGLLDGINIGMLLEIVESQKQFFKNNLSDHFNSEFDQVSTQRNTVTRYRSNHHKRPCPKQKKAAIKDRLLYQRNF
ncbi:hypothetical protein [Zymomonas mobilis]|uniref:hypothetical protein n=1 Tax=Zymomonas mobilis TaxID=542 RepID=UPI00046CA675|nr:hypothetical protein [Zymomonas mobilis]ART93044.1 hypothetical protein B9T50_02345 [Zymomonas mobilis subsp. mobilis]MCP9307384.1 hypothetical protein [Zymomonas mobilis]